MKKVLIIGYGSFGKLMAEKISGFVDVYVHNRSKIVDPPEYVKVIKKEEVKKMDYIIFAVPVQFLKDSIAEFKKYISKKTIILDVSSVKVYPLEILKKNFSQNQILGTHPLFGPESIAKKIPDLKVVLANISSQEETILKVKTFIGEKLKFQVLEMTAEEHDRQMAHVQVLSHFIGFALRGFDLKKDLSLKTLAYRKMYALYENVLNDSDDLFKTIQEYNPYAKEMRVEFINHLVELDKKCDNI
jgi:prephenate dehydrogenase